MAHALQVPWGLAWGGGDEQAPRLPATQTGAKDHQGASGGPPGPPRTGFSTEPGRRVSCSPDPSGLRAFQDTFAPQARRHPGPAQQAPTTAWSLRTTVSLVLRGEC